MQTQVFRFAISTLLMVGSIFFAGTFAARAQVLPHPAFRSSDRGRADEILARDGQGAEISSRDLYLCLLLSGLEDPDIHDRWRRSDSEIGRSLLRERLERALRDAAALRGLASDHPPRPDALRALRLRLLMQVAHEQVWIDRYLAPQVQVRREDVWKRYGESSEWSMTPPTARVRYLFLEAGPPDSAAARERCARRMEEIREQMFTEGLRFEDAARRYSDAPSAEQGGLIPEFERGTHFPAFEEEAFRLSPGEYGRVLSGPRGLYMLYGMEASPRRPRDLEEVEADIRRALFFDQLRGRYVFELDGLREAIPLKSFPYLVNRLEDDETIFEMQGLRLSRSEAWRLFPQFVGMDFQLDTAHLGQMLWRSSDLERIAIDLRRRGLAGDPMLAEAMEWAKTILAAEGALDKALRPRLDACLPDPAAYLRAHGQRLAPAPPEPAAVPLAPEAGAFLQRQGHALSPLALDLRRFDPVAALAALRAPRHALLLVQTRPDPRLSPPRADYELERMARLIEEKAAALRTADFEAIAEHVPAGSSDPWRHTVQLLLEHLGEQSGEFLSLRLWRAEDGLETLPEALHPLAGRLMAGGGLEPLARFGSLERFEGGLALPHTEQIDPLAPASSRLLRQRLAEIVAADLRQRIFEEASSGLQFPEVSVEPGGGIMVDKSAGPLSE